MKTRSTIGLIHLFAAAFLLAAPIHSKPSPEDQKEAQAKVRERLIKDVTTDLQAAVEALQISDETLAAAQPTLVQFFTTRRISRAKIQKTESPEDKNALRQEMRKFTKQTRDSLTSFLTETELATWDAYLVSLQPKR